MPPLIRRNDVDACPGALRLHAAADGPLARVRLPGGMLTGTQLAFLAELAAKWGDGHLELTSRANIQLRALNQADPAILATRLSGAGLLPSAAHETVRNIAAPPLATAHERQLVRDLDRALCGTPALAALPGRFLFAIGNVSLAPDVAALPAGPGYAILFAGTDQGLRVPTDEVVPALLHAAQAFLELRGPAWRLTEMPDGPPRVAAWTAAALGRPLQTAPGPFEAVAEPHPPIGVLPQPDGRSAVGAMVPLSRLSPGQIAVLSRAARLVLTPWRGVLIPDLPPGEITTWLTALPAAGLPVEAVSRWSGVTACAGRPGCAKSLADVRATALAATRFVDGLPVHWIGCDRGCGSPATPHVRAEATPAGWAVTSAGPEEAEPKEAETVRVEDSAEELAEIVASARRR